MSSEVLRQAARLMRERAAEASYGDGAWCSAYLASSIRNMQRNCAWDCPEHAPWGGPDRTEECDQPTRYAGEHIASWHPAVALAVADWLDSVVDRGEAEMDEGKAAVRVARAYVPTDEESADV